MTILRAMHHMQMSADTAIDGWIDLLPTGTFTGADGRGPWKVDNADAVIAASTGKMPVDENHSTDLAAPHGKPSPARGWIKGLRQHGGKIQMQVAWNRAGRALMDDKAYSGISPVFTHKKDGTVLRIDRAGLTNVPNFLQLQSLHHQQENDMLDKVRSALGLAADADEAAVLAAITARNAPSAADTAAAEQVQALNAQMGRIAVAAGLAASASGDAVLTALNARLTQTDDSVKTIQALNARVVELETGGKRAAAEVFVGAAVQAGKIHPSLKDHFIARHMQDAASVEKEAGLMTSINAGGVAGAPAAGGAGGLTAEQKALCAAAGHSEEEFLKALNAREGNV